MKTKPGQTLWGIVLLAIVLFVTQQAWADSDTLTPRLLLNLAGIGGLALVLTWRNWRGWAAINGPPPEPASLILAGLASLALWVPVWWLMDLTNNRLERLAGPLPSPQSTPDMPDALLGLDLQAASYELHILFAVVLLPLVTAWLVWGLLYPDLSAVFGRRRAAWGTSVLMAALVTLSAVQNIAPALPWGLASLPGYLIISLVAGLAVYLTGSPWVGFCAHGAFAYASFTWRDDLFRAFVGKPYTDPGWLTWIVLGVFGAGLALQMIRFRDPRPAEPERRRWPPRVWGLALALLLGAMIVWAALDLDSRRAEETARDADAAATAAAVTVRPACPSSPAPPAPG